MRILNVIHGWHPSGTGGTEVHARGLAYALVGMDHAVGVFARTPDDSRQEYVLTVDWDGPISVLRINNRFQEFYSFEWIYRNEGVHKGFLKSLDSFKPDLVHVHHLTGLTTTILEEVKLRKIPLVMTLHDFWTVCPRGQRMTEDLELCEEIDREKCFTCLGGLWKHLFNNRDDEITVVDNRGMLAPASIAEWDRHMTYALNLCDVLVTPSEFHRERMLDFPIDPDRVIALPHGLPRPEGWPAHREPRPVQRIGFIGSVIPVKGVHILIEAFRKLNLPGLELDIHGAEFVLHGDKDYGPSLRKLAHGANNIHFHGSYQPEEVPRILENIDLLVVPSLWWESFCLTIREGQLAGIPVIASDLGAMREALDGEQNGLLFRVGDVDHLTEVMRRVIDDDALRARLSNRGHTVKDSETHAKEMTGIYALAQERAEARGQSLVVAPPAFPKPPVVQHGPPVHWDKVAMSLSQEGAARMKVQTRMPTAKNPSLRLDIKVNHSGDEIGQVGVDVDLQALRPDAAPGRKKKPTKPGRKKVSKLKEKPQKEPAARKKSDQEQVKKPTKQPRKIHATKRKKPPAQKKPKVAKQEVSPESTSTESHRVRDLVGERQKVVKVPLATDGQPQVEKVRRKSDVKKIKLP